MNFAPFYKDRSKVRVSFSYMIWLSRKEMKGDIGQNFLMTDITSFQYKLGVSMLIHV